MAFMVLFPSGAAATLTSVGSTANPTLWVAATLLPAIFGYSEYRRRQLSNVPRDSLSPATKRWLEAPDLRQLIRHPWSATKANAEFLTRQPSIVREERQWERDTGLR